ncbi:FAM45 family protein [Heterostelium album PN500]|uniref:FAM45 family protein n=1 Tax=Heterostelium pallidum (strain ATCC 26659 / Pp 5 / PN500) TaxID=670386 RepID=D3BSK6_HETP5|nr:FAM45 family protein [Heterostelium album PN500]EFA75471.1 FAM45 family protein [Heterostelium album PN500]|eukprot:XP_020427605.1 FAM45 family protein [Heterostelium album PN500]
MQDISLDDSICIFEKDNSGEVLQTWTYPSVDESLRQVALNRTGLTSNRVNPFTFSKFKNTWIYIYTVSLLNHKDKDASYTPPEPLKHVVAFSICIFRNNFNPEKYASLSQIMSNIYLKLGDPSKLLECQLRAWNKGQFDVGALGKFVDAEFDVRRSYLATSIKDIIKLFQEDIILVWNAMLIKKRVVVYSDKVSSLLKVIRALPLFVFHRQNWSLLRPFVTIDELEIKDLTATGVYCAGFIDSSIKSREDLYDILIDVNSKEVTVASHAKDQFVLGSFHKDILKTLIESADNEEINDQTLIKLLTQKIKDLLGKLESLKVEVDGKSIVTLESLQERKLPAGMDKFLFNVATAEGINER